MDRLICAKPSVKLGQQFGRLTVIGGAFYVRSCKGRKQRRQYVICECSCGEVVCLIVNDINSERTKSCGCLQRETAVERATTHGLSKHPLKDCWYDMVARCTNPACHNYKYYGARGIRVCDEWRHGLAAFIEWASSHGYRKGLEIDRIDNNGNYEPGNCRFVTSKENSRNTRRSRLIAIAGKTLCVAEWADEMGVRPAIIRGRLCLGWSDEDAVLTPLMPHGAKKTITE